MASSRLRGQIHQAILRRTLRDKNDAPVHVAVTTLRSSMIGKTLGFTVFVRVM
jgi:hypothetical protein